MGTTNAWESQTGSAQGSDGSGLPKAGDLIGDPQALTGIYALDKVDLFNLLSIPDATRALPGDPAAGYLADGEISAVYSQAIPYCDKRRAFLLVDPPPDVTRVSGAIDWISDKLGITDPNGAAFWPRLRLPDPVNNYSLRSFAPSGVVAGLYATIDANRGVWKAPAGINATLNGVQSLTYVMNDQENGLLNPLGLNCFRALPVYGRVLWGARTLQGADAEASQWKYVPVRRMALFLEESLYRGLQWVVFEPNAEPLWASIRLNVESFMQTLFLKGAFQGTTPDQAYLVKCDSETTTQADIDNGIVNILVGFAPLKPAEFVVIQIEQLTGQG
jgi:phage tail sheath protein FI